MSAVPRAPGFEPSTTQVNGVPISLLPAVTVLTGAELVPLVQGTDDAATTKRATVTQIVAAAGGGAIAWTGVATAVLAAGINNDVVVAGIATANVVELTLTGDASLTSLVGGTEGKMLIVQNADTVDTLTIENEAATGTAANKFAINGSMIVPPRCAALFRYSGTVARWVKL